MHSRIRVMVEIEKIVDEWRTVPQKINATIALQRIEALILQNQKDEWDKEHK